MQVHAIHDLSNTGVVSILKQGMMEISEPELLENYSPMKANINSNIFYILENGRYASGKGVYYVVEEDGKYISSAGWNEYNNTTALLMTRLYVTKSKRSEYFMGELLLPLMFESTINYKNVWMTFNEKNKALYKWISRSSKDKSNIWPAIWFNFEAVGIRTIYNTSQYVVRKNDKLYR